MDRINVSLYELLKSFSAAADMVSPLLSNHHQQVAYLSYMLSNEAGLPVKEQRDIFIAGLIHDIGSLSRKERLEIIEEEPIGVNNHAFLGERLIKDFKPLKDSAGIIKYHHLPWDHGKGESYGEEQVPLGSHIIHLADRVCVMIKKDKNILSQVPHITESICAKSNTIFNPELIQHMLKLSRKEYIWLDLVSHFCADRIDASLLDIVELGIDDIIEMSVIFSRIIDFRSKFTSRHSAGVAKTAEKLAQLIGFSEAECKMMLAAGYIHDLGKLAIDNEVLEKPSSLNDIEFNEIRAHTYYTYQLLANIPQLAMINEWASYHHERLDGKGYPFHIEGSRLLLGSRIMAVADIFTALTENRPYRRGMDEARTAKILRDMVADGAIDGHVTEVLIVNYKMLDNIRSEAQKEAGEAYMNISRDLIA